MSGDAGFYQYKENAMRNRFNILVAIAVLALAALACQAVTGSPNGSASATEVVPENTDAPLDTEVPLPTPTEETGPASEMLIEDDFTGDGRTSWGTSTDAESSVEYLNDGLNMQLFKENYIVWSSPNDQEYENVHMEVSVLNNGTDSSTALGFMCDQQYPITDSRYYLAITPGGEYAIGKASLALDDVILSNNGEWGKSDLIARDASSYRLAADCANGRLVLYVDGQQIASATDSTYTNGSVTLFIWSGKDIGSVNVTFEDFLMTKLP
jgi:hypothetical protein